LKMYHRGTEIRFGAPSSPRSIHGYPHHAINDPASIEPKSPNPVHERSRQQHEGEGCPRSSRSGPPISRSSRKPIFIFMGESSKPAGPSQSILIRSNSDPTHYEQIPKSAAFV
ncbi:hypothetical protein ACLOJK_035050, partial [Asimina triloba]